MGLAGGHPEHRAAPDAARPTRGQRRHGNTRTADNAVQRGLHCGGDPRAAALAPRSARLRGGRACLHGLFWLHRPRAPERADPRPGRASRAWLLRLGARRSAHDMDRIFLAPGALAAVTQTYFVRKLISYEVRNY